MNTNLSYSAETAKKNATFASPPKLNLGEYALFLNDNYKVFKTKKYENLELSMDCFKSAKPACDAVEFSKIKPKDLIVKNVGSNNAAAIHCETVGGRNLLALDSENNEYNFCRFTDGSMVNSWSLTYKHFPPAVKK